MRLTSTLLILALLIIGCRNKEPKKDEDDSLIRVKTISKNIFLQSNINKDGELTSGSYLICRYQDSQYIEDAFDAFIIKDVIFIIKDQSKLNTNIRIKLPSEEVNAYFREFSAGLGAVPPKLMKGEIIFKRITSSNIEISIVDSLRTEFWQSDVVESKKHLISFSGNHIFKK